jgi:molybdenum-dependent DNA-binding transcriptional regulator ModE
MPGLRIREDGWTVARTRTFLAALSQTGCVTDAARVAGISRKSVNQARLFDRTGARGAGAAGDRL